MATSELDGLKASLTNKFTEFAAQLRQNNIDHVNSLVPIHKEVQKIANARDALVEGIAECFDRVGKVEDELAVNDEVIVKVREIDNKGRINLTRLNIHPDEAVAAREALNK